MSLLVYWGKRRGVSSAWGLGVGKWGLPWGLLYDTSGKRKPWMVPCHSCNIYGIWRSKEVGGRFKVIICGGNASHKVKGTGQFLWGKGGFHYVILLHWNLLGTVKYFIGYLSSLYYCCLNCFISIEIGKAKSAI